MNYLFILKRNFSSHIKIPFFTFIALVYKTLYKEVFQMPNVDETVHKMLHDRPFPLKYDKFSAKGIAEHRE